MLWSSHYSSPFWLTFKQAQELKGTVRKGEKGTPIVFYKQLPDDAKDDDESTEEDERAPFVLCHYTVFNVEQCDGLTLPEIEQPTTAPEIDEDETCEAIVTGWENRPALHLTSATECRAYYRPSTDSVHMPARSRFVDAPHYYSTLFHELVHSTGHESRLNRTFGDHFGDELYSKEELVAEMGAAFLCAIAELPTNTPTATPPPTSRTGFPSWKRITASSSMPPRTHKEPRIASSAKPSEEEEPIPPHRSATRAEELAEVA